jgi:purine-nucleoside/S-methyl-5'-thioadenosine phosphorylase / adenosine deaminase
MRGSRLSRNAATDTATDTATNAAVNSADIGFIYPDWPAPPGVRAAFTLRRGGVSRRPFDSLNLGLSVGDDSQDVTENRRRVRETLRLSADPVWLAQEHGSAVVTLDRVAIESPHREESLRSAEPPRADAAISRLPGAVCAIQVADRMPVLFVARDGAAVGAAHAGWRGLAGGVLEATIAALGAEPYRIAAHRLIAWMGPAISPGHFEVGEEVRAAFLERDAGAAGAFARNPFGRWQCDLYALGRRRLAAAGVQEVYGGGWCTYADASRFFSYRRDGQCGRAAALIWIAREAAG